MEEGGGKPEEKQHRKRQAGRKAEKKKAKNKHEQEQTDQQRNPKAYAFHSVNKVARSVRRSLDIREKRHHVPVVDRTPVEPPPVIIAVVGPPQVGKSTLVQCLIKSFTRTKLSNVRGPVTIVSGKKRRLSIIECNNDINSMIDIAKVADLVLLLVDASFGFEMEIFEFLNICQVHGFPKIMGVLTHLDHFRDNKTLRKTKKRLKHRFWTEVYQGAKLFYLSGMVNGEYQKTEIHNLGRFISVMKFRPLQWRTTHPYILADRIEDVTDPEAVRQDPKKDRSICLYGYVRGTHFKNNSNVHIPGCGDFLVHDLSLLPDPCPLPDRDGKRRRLAEKERSLYAPFSGVGGVVYDKDAVYIDTGGSHFHTTPQEETKPSNELVSGLIDTKRTLDEKMEDSELTLFTGGPTISSSTFKQPMAPPSAPPSEELVTDSKGRQRRKAVFADSGEEGESDGSEEEDDEDDGEEEMEEGEEDGESEDEEGDSEEDDLEESEEEESEEEEPVIEAKPAEKRAKVDIEELDFADSDDELERSQSKPQKQKKQKSQRKPKTESSDDEDESEEGGEGEMEDSDSVSEDSDCSESDDEESESIKPTQPAVRSNKNTNNIKNKITEALEKMNKKTQKLKEEIEQEEGEDDELSRDEEEGESGLGSGEESADMDEGEEGSGQQDSEIGHLKWKENMAGRAQDAFYRRQSEASNLRKLVYGQVHEAGDEDADEDDEVGGLFRVAKRNNEQRSSQRATANSIDCSTFSVDTIQDWDLDEVMAQIRDCFVTGKWEASEDAETLLKQDDELYGDFEDLETGEKHTGKGFEEKGSEDEDSEASGNEGEDDEDKPNVYETPEELRLRKAQEKRAAKKARLKEMFDRDYDDKDGDGEKGTHYDALKAEMEDQAQLNRKEFESMDEETRSQYEGFRPGLYVRVQVDNMPCEFMDNFDPTYPIILGALNSAEQNIGCVQVRLKKHRWHKKILKTRDPLVLSLGWRRFQSVVLYSIQDHNMRHRLLKYTPEHLHCNATFWGPITPQGTGVLAIQSLSGKTANFRICATGVVLELDKSMTIVKKLKLTGTPQKIYKKTAFIEGMFTSALEVSRFEGASIRTVSGVRGQIKKAAKTPEGAFRATFEDKILLSDIAFVRTWYPVAIPRFYNPVTTLLLPPSEKEKWLGMKTVGQLKREAGMRQKVNEDHLYKDIHRKPKMFKPLRVPKDLQRALPFKDKPKEARHSVDAVQAGRVAVVRDAKEKKVAELMSMLKTLHEHKMKQRRSTMRERAAQHQKQTARIDAKRQVKQKEVKKQIYRVLGKKERRKER